MYERLVEAGKPFVFDFVPDPPRKKVGDENRTKAGPQATSQGKANAASAKLPGASGNAAEIQSRSTASEEPKKYPIPLPAVPNDQRGQLKNHFDDKLQTNLTQDKLSSTLRYMQREARTAMQETGINYLFLAIGFLAWKESDSSDKERLAPLLLIPVKIEKIARGGGEPLFSIEWDEDEIQFNLSLQKKLVRDFDLRIPELGEGVRPEDYFQKMQGAIKSKPAWGIRREALLGFFSFHKLSMYADIDPANWDLSGESGSSSIVEQLVCGGDGGTTDEEIDEATLYAPDYDVDRNQTAGELILSLDADSSQQSALVDIRNGRNLVIEGPPGTGKSQTITNAIADAIGSGKTVLFVAEKLAALQVVHDRMSALGLDDFCLELHSDAASPRQVFESLSDRMGTTYPSSGELGKTRETLARLRDRLNHYVSEMAMPVGPAGDALYYVLWVVVALRGEGATFHRMAVERVPRDRNELKSSIAELNVFASVLKETPNPTQWVWWGFFPEDYSFRRLDEIQACLTEIERESQSVANSANELGRRWGGAQTEAYKIARKLDVDEIRGWASQTSTLTSELASILVDEVKAKFCQNLLSLIGEKKDAESRLRNQYRVSDDLLNNKRAAIKSMLGLEVLSGNDSIEDAVALRDWMVELHQAIGELEPQFMGLAEAGIRPSDVLDDLTRCIKLVQLIRHPIVNNQESVTEQMFRANAIEDLRSAYKQSIELQSAKQKLTESLDAIVAGTGCDVAGVADRLKEIEMAVKAVRAIAGGEDTLAKIGEIARWSNNAETCTDQLIHTGMKMKLPAVQPPASFDAFTRASTLIQLIRHRIVAEVDCLREPMFRGEGRRAFQQASRVADELRARRQALEEAFHMPSVPEPGKVTEIAKTLRRHRRSWFKLLSGEYRSARADLDEFAAVGVQRELNEWIRSLEDLDALSNEEAAFRNQEDLVALLGDGFQGVQTDWETLKVRFDWVHTAQQHGLDYESACSLLAQRATIIPDVSNVELKRTESSFASAWSAPSDIATRVADGNPNQVPLEILKRRVTAWAKASKELATVATQLKLPMEWNIGHAMQLIETLRQIENADAASKAFAVHPEHTLRLGATYRGQETNWKQLETLFNWVKMTQNAGADYTLTKSLFAIKNDQLSQIDVKAALVVAQRVSELFAAAPKDQGLPERLRSLDHHSLTQMLESTIGKLGPGIEGAIQIGNDHRTSMDALSQQVDLSSKVGLLKESISDGTRWEALNERWLHKRTMTSPEEVKQVLDWLADGRKFLAGLPEQVRVRLLAHADAQQIASLCDEADDLSKRMSRLSAAHERLASFGRMEPSWMPIDTESVLGETTTAIAQTLQQKTDELPAWSKFCRSLDNCSRMQLEKFCNLAIEGSIEPDFLSPSYELSVLEIAAENAFKQSEMLRTGSGKTMDGLREEFQLYDRELRELGKNEIASRAANRSVPSGNSKGRVGELTELALIRHESQKQRRHCRIRDLMQRAGAAVQSLKPCLMMSPLSVSRFISESDVEFDMVIMDEASQIKPEDAIGTILRAKQLVVVGDPKQLPPTSFFDRVDEDLADEESTQLDNTESVLEAAMKVFQPFRRLRWHYRSKHESLIRFSNSRFYDNDLVVFPSPSGDPDTYGIRHVFVEGATCTSGLNMKEAAAVVEEIVRHAIARPDESLGIGTFNKKQAEMIAELLEKRCENDAAAAVAVDRLRQCEEELFIKNLENLQGDERDVIFVCYTYGKDPASNRLMQRFGPINSEKGWRRLNVLITRSRHRMVVFSSFHPGDIQGGPEKSRGVNAYKDFLSYAITGAIDDGGIVGGKAPDSPFEIAVCRTIEQMGLEAVPQVGVAGFFIDIGVRRREGDRSFLLGIECDGATYHSARSARDRDRLREEIIRSRGWEIHRIWSTDWFLNQRVEETKLKQAILNVTNSLDE
ncbi:DUF4011 domain-containing protein [Rhodopirellula europaea]|uniref:DNA and RNA helicase and helicase subunits-like protein n=1 Tax=Rhodopirellula europaea 6C TaxID=1263867 RepID=M2AG10_9BACT|nr:DUF4011 domain-containing protein [Rhodopirellula europaea]EMB16035.1 DNA and RNA helicase and helicase subunits-like protein [Rhodopirellula europaea 6C]